MRVLNLYAGIGGNRKLWTDVQVTAVEINPEIARIYQDHFPDDEMIIGDAHQYLLDHFKEYEFIWSSPPCPTHSRFNFLNSSQNKLHHYPDMTLYQEIILLKSWYDGKWCIENVVSYYDPLIPPVEVNNHYFWSNIKIYQVTKTKRGIRGVEVDYRKNRVGYNLSEYNLNKHFEKKIMNNCTEPELGLHILNCARKIYNSEAVHQIAMELN